MSSDPMNTSLSGASEKEGGGEKAGSIGEHEVSDFGTSALRSTQHNPQRIVFELR